MDITKVVDRCRNWQDFREKLRPLTEKQKGDCFETLTKFYLKLHPEYETSLSNVWGLQDVPPSVKKKLNLPSPDEGIDLIAETKDGKFWAIQCKYREDEAASLSRKELSTFTDLAFNICKNIELALVCTNADRFSHKLAMYGERLSFCTGEAWRALDRDFFIRLHKLLIGKAAPLKPLIPRAHQMLAVQKAYKHFVHGKTSLGKLISPCGTGKSLTGYWIAEKLEAKRILVAVPSLALIRQTLFVWASESVAHKRDIHWIAVCSDETVAETERDDAAVRTQDLGIRVHTDADEIAGWLNARKRGTTVVFTTYQSGLAIAEAAKKSKTSFDLGILDEAHKTVGKTGGLFSHLLYDENIRIKKRVFMTATERHYRGQSDEIISMDDPQIYGDTFETLSFKKALETKPQILSDYKIVTMSVTKEDIASLIKQNLFVKPDKGRWDKEVEAEMLASIIALRKAMKKYPIRHAVSFHSSIARAKAFKHAQDNFSTEFPQYGSLETFHVSGNTPTAVRSREIEEFASSKRSLITNARCLTEGVDVPKIDCVLFADPRKSTIDIVQAVGRALRPSHGKKFGYVIVPVLVDKKSDFIRPEQSGAFEPIITVLRALAANDERIIEYFRTISQGKKWTGRTIPVEIDVPLGLNVDIDKFVSSIKLHYWSRLAKLSWRPFEEARLFVRSLGLKRYSEWIKYCKGEIRNKGKKPIDIPSNPQNTYRDKGWISWGDWLGTGFVSRQFREYRSFRKALAFVHNLGLKSVAEWNMYCKNNLPEKGKKPDDIPVAPHTVYKNEGWKGMGDWLGTGTIATHFRQYRPFKEARKFVQRLGLKSMAEWKKYCRGELRGTGKKPDDIPAKPYRTYKDKGWKNWGDWLGTGTIASHLRVFRPFTEARKFVHTLKLRNQNEWRKYFKGEITNKGIKPHDIPSYPNETYKGKGWINWGDWLGTGRVALYKRGYLSYEKARAYVHKLKLQNQHQWRKYCGGKLRDKPEKPTDIPSDPYKVYKNNGWISMGDWLGTGTVAPFLRVYSPFEKARKFVHNLNLKSAKEWKKFCQGKMPEKGKLPLDIPATPQRTYKHKGWINWGNWLGTGAIANRLRKFRPFGKARTFVNSLGLRNQTDWRNYCKGLFKSLPTKPDDIPAQPYGAYQTKGWISWGDWLGTGAIASYYRKYRDFKTARKYVHTLRLKSTPEWRKYCKGELQNFVKKPDDIPANPDRIYLDKGWLSWGDWLGTGFIATRDREYLAFEKALKFVHKVKLNSRNEWRRYCKGDIKSKDQKPVDIPVAPQRTYENHWKGWPDWLGKTKK